MRHRFRSAARAALLAAVLLASSSAARAGEPDARSAQALELFERSSAAYDRGRFGEAIALLLRSYELKREPVLLYNLGRAYEGLGDLPNAARAYEAFLAGEPNAPDRGALERRVATLRRQVAEQESLRRQAGEGRERSPSVLPWAVAGAGAAGVITGGAFGLLANKRSDDAKAEPTYLRAAELQSDAKTISTVANVCFVAGAVILVTGVIWGLVDASTAARSRTTASIGTFAF